MDLVEQVDAELDEIRGLLAPMSDRHQPASEGRMTIANDRLAFIRGDVTVRPSEDPTEIRKKEQDDKEHVEFQPMTIDQDYDKFIREMAYDRRARPTDRTLTEEEIAAKQVLDLERSEKDRHDRMNGVNPESNTKRPKPVWKSEGDDLGDDDYANIIQEQVNDEEEQPLTYKDGVLINDQIFMSAAADSGSDSEDGSVSSSEGGSENDKTLDAEDSIEADVIEAENGALYESASESEKGESDLEIDDKEGIEDFKNAKSAGDEIIDDSETKIAKAELPFTFEAPQSYEEMLELFNGRKTSEHVVIVERLRVLNNAKLGPAQKANLESLMTYVVEHVGAIASSLPIDMEYVKQFETQSQILATQFPQRFAIMCKAKLISFRNTFNRAICHKKKQCMPNLGELLFFKLIHHTFPTSDLDHPVINPAFLLLGQYLGQGMYLSHQDILSGIFVCQLLVEVYFDLH